MDDVDNDDGEIIMMMMSDEVKMRSMNIECSIE